MAINANNNTIILNLRVSCEIFWKYQLMLTVNYNDFAEPADNINSGNNAKTLIFSRLERHLCDAMISHIHEDLAINNDEEKIKQLCDISNKFHIHGHTTHSILDLHEGCIYICTHC